MIASTIVGSFLLALMKVIQDEGDLLAQNRAPFFKSQSQALLEIVLSGSRSSRNTIPYLCKQKPDKCYIRFTAPASAS